MPKIVTQKQSVKFILFLVGIFCILLLAIQPFTLDKMPETADGLLHLYRVAAVDYSLKFDNPLWIRYSTAIVYGYGAPLFNYFPPLSYYISSWLHTFGMPFVQSWLMTMILYTMLSASGMYLLGRIWTGSSIGGWLSAIAMIYAPYYLFDSVARGTSSELAALAVLPFALYGFTRLAFCGRRIDFLMAVGAFALFIPMHTLMTLHGTALLGVYCLFLCFNADNKSRTVIHLLLAGMLGLLITSFFWLPAFLETDAVKINLIAENLNQIDVTRHLRPLHEILTLPFTADPTQMAKPIPITLSWVQLGMSFVGVILAFRQGHRLLRNLLLGSWLVLLVLIFMNTSQSGWLWENVPLIGYTQFPWRVLGLASLILALMTGISVWLAWLRLPKRWTRYSVLATVILVLMGYSVPWTYTLYLDDIELKNVTDVHEFERRTGQLTVSSYSEYLPISTDESQLDPIRLIERFEQNDIIPRLVETESLSIRSAEWTSTAGELVLDSSIEQILIFDWLYIDGWTAEIDGHAVEVYPSSPVGLVAVDVPQGQFRLSISLQSTPIQSISVLLSLISLAGVIVVFIRWRSQNEIVATPTINDADPKLEVYMIVIAVSLSVFFGKSLVLDNVDSPFKSERFGNVDEPFTEIPRLANFDNQIDLIDVEIPEGEISGRFVDIKLYWKLHDTLILGDYSTIVRLRNPDGIVIAEKTSFQPGGLATHNWVTNAYIMDTVQLEMSPFTAPLDIGQTFTLDVSLFDPITQQQLNVINEVGNPVDVKYVLGTINDPTQNEAWQQERIVALDANQFGDAPIGLYLRAELPQLPQIANVGDELLYKWTWQKVAELDSRVPIDYKAQLVWLDDNKQVIAGTPPVSLDSAYGLQQWSLGEAITHYQRMYVPADLPAGDYPIGIQLLDESMAILGEPFISNHMMAIRLPDRKFDEPEVDVVADLLWDNGIRLLGYSIDPEHNKLQLHWQTQNLLDKNLRLFVHLLDENELIVAQSDGVPADWTRPVTGWVTDEFVTTSHQFDSVSGDYDLRIGWYEPITGDRVRINEMDSILLSNVRRLD